jgi:hypothetical protein
MGIEGRDYLMGYGEWVREAPRSSEEMTRLRVEAAIHYAEEHSGSAEVKFTCDHCELSPRCELVFDCYNTEGDCLLSK